MRESKVIKKGLQDVDIGRSRSIRQGFETTIMKAPLCSMLHVRAVMLVGRGRWTVDGGCWLLAASSLESLSQYSTKLWVAEQP